MTNATPVARRAVQPLGRGQENAKRECVATLRAGQSLDLVRGIKQFRERAAVNLLSSAFDLARVRALAHQLRHLQGMLVRRQTENFHLPHCRLSVVKYIVDGRDCAVDIVDRGGERSRCRNFRLSPRARACERPSQRCRFA